MSLNNYMREASIKAVLFTKINILIVLLTTVSIQQVVAQKDRSFIGVLEYKITVRDTAMRSLIPENRMILYTNDTIVRMENFTQQLGMQATIRHIEKKQVLPFVEHRVWEVCHSNRSFCTGGRYNYSREQIYI